MKMGLTLKEYNALFDIIMKIKVYGTKEQKDAAHGLLLVLEKPEAKAKMTEQQVREFYRNVFGFPNE